MGQKPVWAVLGGGNGGQSAAGHLGIMGFEVRIYDIFPATIEAIKRQGGINVEGSVKGFGKVALATTSIGDAVKGADIIMVTAPAVVHRDIASKLAPFLKDGQIVFIHPGATFGVLEFRKVLNDFSCKADIVLSESQSLIYACRATKPGNAHIMGIKNKLQAAAFPATETDRVIALLNQAYPNIVSGKNVLETSLTNLNAIMHPGPSILNSSLIESKHEWKYYLDGITPSIGEFIVELDKERVELGSKVGLELPGLLEMYRIMYDVAGDNLTDIVRSNKAYHEISGQKKLDTRYIFEDIPTGLVPMVSLAEKAGTSCERMKTICRLGGFLLKKDFLSTGRTLENLGLGDLGIDQIILYVETGKVKK
ncbi:MAG: NAD/NADP octopine/nopaline dehydrogenase family protein [Spirochaetia bacterium]|nr:NAD/NADP octopine/nopaline dehydrogenase family protein [Spirochaetia bacterium]